MMYEQWKNTTICVLDRAIYKRGEVGDGPSLWMSQNVFFSKEKEVHQPRDFLLTHSLPSGHPMVSFANNVQFAIGHHRLVGNLSNVLKMTISKCKIVDLSVWNLSEILKMNSSHVCFQLTKRRPKPTVRLAYKQKMCNHFHLQVLCAHFTEMYATDVCVLVLLKCMQQKSVWLFYWNVLTEVCVVVLLKCMQQKFIWLFYWHVCHRSLSGCFIDMYATEVCVLVLLTYM